MSLPSVSWKNVVVGIAIAVCASALMGATKYVWSQKADVAAVDSLADKVNGMAEQLHQIKVGVDSANLRLTQMRCGPKISEGCR